MAFGGLADVATGQPEMLSELTLTTALRTAATSALAARWLARPGSRTMALIGNGAQSEFQALAFHHLLGIDEIRLFDIDAAATAKLQRNLRSVPGLTAAGVHERGRLRCAVPTSSPRSPPTRRAPRSSPPTWSSPACTSMRWVAIAPARPSCIPMCCAWRSVVVEYEPQTRVEGDIQQLPADFAVTELWRVLQGSAPGREDARQVTVFDSVGFALEDFSALRWLRDSALELGLGSAAHLVPELDDPKDLFALLSAPVAHRAAPVEAPRSALQSA